MRLDWGYLQDHWLAVQVRPGWEFSSSSHLQERGYKVFCPTYLRHRKWSDRAKIVQAPLFPGYLFVRFHSANGQLIVSVPGVIRVLCVNNHPIPVDDDEIRALTITHDSGLPCRPCPFAQIGQQVEIREGPLRGVRGRVVRTKSKQRLVISVMLLQKSVFVEINDYGVVPLPLS